MFWLSNNCELYNKKMNFLLVTISCIIVGAGALRWGMIGSGVENVKRFQHSYDNKSNLYVILPSNSVRMYFFQLRFTICQQGNNL